MSLVRLASMSAVAAICLALAPVAAADRLVVVVDLDRGEAVCPPGVQIPGGIRIAVGSSPDGSGAEIELQLVQGDERGFADLLGRNPVRVLPSLGRGAGDAGRTPLDFAIWNEVSLVMPDGSVHTVRWAQAANGPQCLPPPGDEPRNPVPYLNQLESSLTPSSHSPYGKVLSAGLSVLDEPSGATLAGGSCWNSVETRSFVCAPLSYSRTGSFVDEVLISRASVTRVTRSVTSSIWVQFSPYTPPTCPQ